MKSVYLGPATVCMFALAASVTQGAGTATAPNVFAESALAGKTQTFSGDDPILGSRRPAEADPKSFGWKPKAQTAVNAAFASSKNVVGQADGSSETYGLSAHGAFDFADARSEWRNSASYTANMTRTPTLPRYAKSLDDLRFETMYMYGWPWGPSLGPFGRFAMQTSMFVGEDVRPQPTNYDIAHRDGSTQRITGDTLRLTDGFAPMALKESVGGYWKPIDSAQLRLDMRIGAGAQQVLANGQLAISGSGAGGVVSVLELRDLSQVGLETALAAKGAFDERTSWEASIESLTPFISNKLDSDSRSPWRLTNFEALAKLTTKVAPWASLSYDYRVQVKPQLVDVAQQSHMIVFNFQHDFF